MPELRHFRAFREVYRTQSLSKAARALNITPSAVSRSVSQLEQWLGVKLVDRTTTHVKITVEGERYFEFICDALETLDWAARDICREMDATEGKVRVGLPSTYARTVVLPKLQDFFEQNPGIDLDLVICDSVPPDPEKQKLDIWLQFGQPIAPSYTMKAIYEAPVRLVASPAYLKNRPPLVTPEDLEDHVCLIGHVTNSLPWRLVPNAKSMQNVREYRQAAAGRLQIFDHIDIVYDAARMGLGIMAADVGMVVDDLLAGELVRVLPDFAVFGFRPWESHLLLVSHGHRIVPRRIKVVKDFLIDTVGTVKERLGEIEGLGAPC